MTTKILGIVSLFVLALTLFLPYWSIGEINVTWLKLLVDAPNADLIGVLLLIIGSVLLIVKSDKTIALALAIIGGAFPLYRLYKISTVGDVGALTPSFGIGGYLLIAASIIQVIAYFKVEELELDWEILFASTIMVLADQISKAVIRSKMTLYESITVIPGFFHLTYITNDGMAFGINFPFGIYIFSTISFIFTIFLFWYLWTIKNHGIIIRTGVGLIIAGAIGNLIDRIFLGEVVDFLDFMIGNYHWYVFNFADSYVTVGMGFILYDSFFIEPKKENIPD